MMRKNHRQIRWCAGVVLAAALLLVPTVALALENPSIDLGSGSVVFGTGVKGNTYKQGTGDAVEYSGTAKIFGSYTDAKEAKAEAVLFFQGGSHNIAWEASDFKTDGMALMVGENATANIAVYSDSTWTQENVDKPPKNFVQIDGTLNLSGSSTIRLDATDGDFGSGNAAIGGKGTLSMSQNARVLIAQNNAAQGTAIRDDLAVNGKITLKVRETETRTFIQPSPIISEGTRIPPLTSEEERAFEIKKNAAGKADVSIFASDNHVVVNFESSNGFLVMDKGFDGQSFAQKMIDDDVQMEIRVPSKDAAAEAVSVASSSVVLTGEQLQAHMSLQKSVLTVPKSENSLCFERGPSGSGLVLFVYNSETGQLTQFANS